MQFPAMIMKWALAIKQWEGANPALHNPGNLKYSSLIGSFGGTRGRKAADGGWLAAFPDDQTGLNALCQFLMLGASNELVAFHAPESRTLAGFTKVYAGNPPQGYITGIETELGVPGTTLVSTFLT